MAARQRKLRARRSAKIETLEARVVMSADPLLAPPLTHHGGDFGGGMGHGFVETAPQHDPNANFWIDSRALVETNDLGQRVEQTLAEAHAASGQAAALAKYGLTGRGQTVAVIDSGIAYNHTALGTGIGGSSRVVGGWDFTENDANFYDDGPSGGHGSHVAGIVGARGTTHTGVATGVDLVGLRVFDDAGNGYFTWVEQALRWVINNRTAYANPITAINLSLGTTWNALTVPLWSTIEDEFATLASQGVFIAVSAGNAYTTYNTPGLSYPGASSNVVPVMSLDDNGQLSYFSQRAQRALGAPGRNILSTVPDYSGSDANTTDDDWVNMSGTSMAAPYVAGASALVREAMQFVGMTGINQATIYNHLMNTADTFFDAASNASYKKMNVLRAIDALMPTDDYGSTTGTAHGLGTLTDNGTATEASRNGLVTTLADVDYFTFTAGSTGTATFTASGITNSLTSRWVAGSGWTTNGNACSVNVVAGQTYTIGFGTGAGLGRYTLSVNVQSSTATPPTPPPPPPTTPDPPVSWGAAALQQTRSGLAVSGERWYAVSASRGGFFTVDATVNAGAATVQVYDANRNLLSSSSASRRADVWASGGQSLLVRVAGESTDLSVRLTNAVTQLGSTVTVTGTTAADDVRFAASRSVWINGVGYWLGGATAFQFVGGGGADTATLVGSTGDDVATLSATSATLTGVGYSASVSGVATVTVEGGSGGNDVATFSDSAGDDEYFGWHNRGSLRGAGFQRDALGFDDYQVRASTGNDRATLYDTAGNESYTFGDGRVQFVGTGFRHDLHAFDSSTAIATTGSDTATFNDTAGNDVYVAGADRQAIYGASFAHEARGFRNSVAISTRGYDSATYFDTAGDDAFNAWSTRATYVGSGSSFESRGFYQYRALGGAGIDRAVFYDSAGNESYTGWSNRAWMSGGSWQAGADGFDVYEARATGGNDSALFYDSAGDDLFAASPTRARMSGAGYAHDATGFDNATAVATLGTDRAVFYDSAGNDTYVGSRDRAFMYGWGFVNDARGFDRTTAFSSGGADTATFYDTSGDDRLAAWSNRAVLHGSGFHHDARNFRTTRAVASGGNDTASFYGATSGETVSTVSGATTVGGTNYANTAAGFDSATRLGSVAAPDTAGVEAIDHIFGLLGAWSA
ncbi:MAG: S8 family serine peptidase [Lacipirellulaceae bacterium]